MLLGEEGDSVLWDMWQRGFKRYLDFRKLFESFQTQFDGFQIAKTYEVWFKKCFGLHMNLLPESVIK